MNSNAIGNSATKFFLGACLALMLGVLALLGLPAAILDAAPRAVITVNSNGDGTGTCSSTGAGTCTLRDAITFANSNGGADTINVGVSGIITLSSVLPAIADTLTINGNNVTLNGNDATRILNLNSGIPVTLTNITFQKGRSPGSGAAIYNYGLLNIISSSFISNTSSAGQGGAIQNGDFGGTPGFLTVTNSIFSLNRADSHGGAIDNDAGSARIVNSTFTNNATTGNGGGGAIDNDAPVTILNSTFTNNSTAASYGGAVWIFSSATIGNSTFSNNTAASTGEGGAIQFASTGTGTITSSTFVRNHAENGGAISIVTSNSVAITNTTLSGNTANNDGGGIASANGTVTLNNVTITNNTADNNYPTDTIGDGGGIKIASGTVNIKNTIIAGNFDTPGNLGSSTKHPDCSGTLTTLGNNLLGNNTGCSGLTDGVSGDKVGTGASPKDPKLGPLGYYGGATLVHSLLAASPALNAGNNSTCAATDQRGVIRPLTVGNPCDIGAYEGIGFGLYLPLISK